MVRYLHIYNILLYLSFEAKLILRAVAFSNSNALLLLIRYLFKQRGLYELLLLRNITY